MRTALVLSGLLALGFVAGHAPSALADTPPAASTTAPHPLIKFTPPAHIAGQKGLEPSSDGYRVFMRVDSPILPGGKINVPVHSFEYAVTSPRDAASGQASGRRTWKPIRIITPVGSSTPKLAEAAAKGIIFKSVTFTFYKPVAGGAGGESKPFYTIKLTNAVVASVKTALAGGKDALPSEQLSLTFQKIEWTNNQTKTMAADDWEARN